MPDNFINAEHLQKMLDSTEDAALLLDRRFRVVEMNLEARLHIPLSVGTDISECFLNGGIDKLQNIMSGEICSVDILLNGEETTAAVFCACDRLLLFVGDLGYSTSLRALKSSEVGESIRARLWSVAEKLIDEGYQLRTLPFFDISAVSDAILSEISLQHPCLRKRIRFENRCFESFGIGSEQGFTLIFAAICSLLLDFLDGESITVKTECGRNSLYLDFLSSESRFSPLPSNQSGELRRIRLIAEANLWSFKTFSDTGGRVGYRLVLPLVKSGEEFLVRDIISEFIRETVALAFSNGTRNSV